MLAPLDSGYRSDSVYMVRRGHDHRIDVLVLLIEHYAEVTVFSGIRVAVECARCVPPINIAQGDNVLAADVSKVTSPLPAHTDACYIELFTRRLIAGTSQHIPGHNSKGRRRSGSTHKITT
jgi:hypothetical protein